MKLNINQHESKTHRKQKVRLKKIRAKIKVMKAKKFYKKHKLKNGPWKI